MKLRHTPILAAAFALGWLARPAQQPAAAPAPANVSVVKPQRSEPQTLVEPAALPAALATVETVTLSQVKAQRLPGSGLSPVEKLQQLADFADADPQSALSYAQTLPAGEQMAALATVFHAWAAKDPAAAAAELEDNLDSPLGLAGEQAAAAGEAVATAWAAMQALGAIAARNPAQAVDLFHNLTNASAKTAAAEPLAAQWAAQDPAGSAQWALSLADFEQKSAALRGVAASWMAQDPAAASRWVNELPAGAAKDAAVAALVSSQALRNDIPSAAQWAQSITDPAARQELMTELADRYAIFLKLP
jgi:hypothetical protein